MKPVEMFVLFGAGYVSGLSVLIGFVLQGLKKLYHRQWSGARETVWLLAMAINAIVCGLTTVFLLILTVQDFDRPDFWPRAMMFALGIGGGMAFAFLSVRFINHGVKVYQRDLGA